MKKKTLHRNKKIPASYVNFRWALMTQLSDLQQYDWSVFLRASFFFTQKKKRLQNSTSNRRKSCRQDNIDGSSLCTSPCTSQWRVKFCISYFLFINKATHLSKRWSLLLEERQSFCRNTFHFMNSVKGLVFSCKFFTIAAYFCPCPL